MLCARLFVTMKRNRVVFVISTQVIIFNLGIQGAVAELNFGGLLLPFMLIVG